MLYTTCAKTLAYFALSLSLSLRYDTYDCLCICDCCINFCLFIRIRLKSFGCVHSLILWSPSQLKQLCLGLIIQKREAHIYIYIYHLIIKTSQTAVHILQYSDGQKLSWQNMYSYVYLAGFKGSADLSTGKASKNTCSYLNN